ncbi:MAG: Tim44/TimA family putative adaptor protein [Rickettsiales bacterium]|jgi:predicted lipid-binding transport protein (Tim44 family)|nr:Tim44/TimA family putative adaptor protein [Rickettsiales bacterium]
MTVDIIIFALIAIYILIKLYNVIGSDDLQSGGIDNSKVKEASVINLSKDSGYSVVKEKKEDKVEKKCLEELPKDILAKIKEVKTKDKTFSVVNFLNNSEKAFELIINAFADYDTKSINLLTDEDAKTNFTSSMDEQKKLSYNINIDIISFLEKSITDISIKNNICHISILFITEQIFYIADKDNKIIKGDRTKIEKIEDKWVFRKSLKAANPIWHVVETQS